MENGTVLVVCITVLFAAINVVYYSEKASKFQNKVLSVSAGGFHTCVVIEANDKQPQLKCFGDNLSGQTGLELPPGSRDRPNIHTLIGDDESEVPRALPVVDLGASGAGIKEIRVATGTWHTCALIERVNQKTTLQCWGSNGEEWGQLGVGSFDIHSIGKKENEMGIWLPTLKWEEGGRVEQVDAGYGHSCAKLNTSKVLCWGWNEYNQLGMEDRLNRHSPQLVKIGSSKAVVEVKVGGVHSCVLLEDKQVRCWGSSANGQAGVVNTASKHTSVPVVVQLSQDAETLALGSTHSCALLVDGGVECWGKLGKNGDMESNLIFEFVKPAIQLSSGKDHVCVVLEDHSAYCWGGNSNAQVGCVQDSQVIHKPCLVSKNVVQIAAGRLHTCIVMLDQTLACWGDNTNGQLGLGDTLVRARPTPVEV